MTGYIYTLCDGNGNIFYVGSTTNPKNRCAAHTTIRKSIIPLYVFIVQNNINCQFSIVEEIEFSEKSELLKAEYFWIEQFRQWGFSLQNIISNKAVKRQRTQAQRPLRIRVSCRLPVSAIFLLKKLAKKEKRAPLNMLDVLVCEALENRRKIQSEPITQPS